MDRRKFLGSFLFLNYPSFPLNKSYVLQTAHWEFPLQLFSYKIPSLFNFMKKFYDESQKKMHVNFLKSRRLIASSGRIERSELISMKVFHNLSDAEEYHVNSLRSYCLKFNELKLKKYNCKIIHWPQFCIYRMNSHKFKRIFSI